MRVATIKIRGLTPYSPSKAFQSEKNEKESPEDFDKRCWKEHAHTNDKGEVVIPAVAVGLALANAAAYLSKGGFLKKKGSATWAQNFLCGLAVATSPTIGHNLADCKDPELVYSNADGRRGSGKRVWRRFPIFHEWAATLTVHILDDSIPEDVFSQVVDACGHFNGFGRYAPRVGGFLGRFIVEDLKIK